MRRLKDDYLSSVEKVVPLFGKTILEVGCGNGSRSVEIAKRCLHLTSVEPDVQMLESAKTNNSAQNITYIHGKAEILDFPDKKFDAVIYTLSFHHVPNEAMSKAIDEAIRVTKKGGNIIFLEPAEDGTFFEAEIAFDACDGDERREKRAAYKALIHHSGYESVAEIPDETIFCFDSLDDFMATMAPRKIDSNIEEFLKKNDYVLRAARRINIFRT